MEDPSAGLIYGITEGLLVKQGSLPHACVSLTHVDLVLAVSPHLLKMAHDDLLRVNSKKVCAFPRITPDQFSDQPTREIDQTVEPENVPLLPDQFTRLRGRKWPAL